jgi:hypothetical protein
VARARRRGVRAFVIVLVVLVALVGIAWILVETVGRPWAEERIATEVASALDIDAASVDASVEGGSLVLQGIAGRLDDVHVTADDVAFEGLGGDLELTATGVPLDADLPTERLRADLRVPADTVQDLVRQSPDLESATVALGTGAVTVSSTVRILAAELPVSVDLDPSLDDGVLVLTPTAVDVNKLHLSIDAIRESPFAAIANSIAAPQRLCLAEYLPSSLRIDSVDVTGSAATLRVSGRNVAIGTLGSQSPGHC